MPTSLTQRLMQTLIIGVTRIAVIITLVFADCLLSS